MRDEVELNISELRRKQRGYQNSDNNPPSGGESGGEEFREPKFEQGTWKKTSRPWEEQPPRQIHRTAPASQEKARVETPVRLPFDPLRIFEALRRKWYWWFGSALICGLAGFFLKARESSTAVTMQLVRREIPVLFRASEKGEAIQPQYFSDLTLHSFMKSPEFLKRVHEKSKHQVGDLYGGVTIDAPEGSQLLTLELTGNYKPEEAVEILNLYGEEFIQFTKEMQTRGLKEMITFLEARLADVAKDLKAVNREMDTFSVEGKFLNADKQVEAYLAQLSDLEIKVDTARIELGTQDLKKLQLEREELARLSSQYTDLHPSVMKQKSKIAALEKTMSASQEAGQGKINLIKDPGSIATKISSESPQAQSLAKQLEELKAIQEKVQSKLNNLSEKSLGYASTKTRFTTIDTLHTILSSRLREARLFHDSAMGFYQVVAPASLDRASITTSKRKSLMLGFAGALMGLTLMVGFITVMEIFDSKIRTSADLQRVTGLPLLASVGNLNAMTAAAQAKWAFRTWTIIKGKMDGSPSEGLVCGIISAHAGEGRSTWINHLVQTANQRGLRVLTVATRPSEAERVHPHEPVPPKNEAPRQEQPVAQLESLVKMDEISNVLAFPGQITQQLNDPQSQSIVHIPLPGWVWNLERRKQWESALNDWQQIENLVLLVELPPASEPESILLAEKLPNLIWLAESGKSSVEETRAHIETLRHAGCNLVGSVLNREPGSFFRKIIARWTTGAVLFFLITAQSLVAVTTNSVPEGHETQAVQYNTNRTFGIVNQSQRASWQKRLTLGPGDILNFGIYGETNLNRNEVPIGPDGRVTYLQSEIVAAGLTVDELREKMEAELARYYRVPKLMISPVSFRSKKYYVLGKVVSKGVYTLDRPITLLEAVAKARGLESGILERNTVEMADLQKSFLMRAGQRLPIDFEKLFREGDLSQNVAIEPEDFLYFPAATLNEIYVLGQVRTPGVMIFAADTSVIAAIANRGGFADRAYKSRVAVIRGSLTKPETFTVDTHSILDARSPDFKLLPKDIVYVHHRPFAKVEELLDMAASAFVQSAAAAWGGASVGPLIRSPIFPPLQ